VDVAGMSFSSIQSKLNAMIVMKMPQWVIESITLYMRNACVRNTASPEEIQVCLKDMSLPEMVNHGRSL